MSWLDTLFRHYPSALPIPELHQRVNRYLETQGFTPEMTLLANAICRDELNHGAIEPLARYWGEHFDLAGLGGFPSAGATGFSAYAAHVPAGGTMFLLYGAHIGISNAGEMGKTERPGLAEASTSCGALVSFLGKLRADAGYQPEFTERDPEQFLLEKSILDRHPELARGSLDPLSLTDAAYEVIDERVGRLADEVRGDRPLALVGGILVNTTLGSHDYFVPRRADLRRGGDIVEWLGHLRQT